MQVVFREIIVISEGRHFAKAPKIFRKPKNRNHFRACVGRLLQATNKLAPPESSRNQTI